MASVYEAITALLVARCRSVVGDRVYDTHAKQGAQTPYLTFQIVDNRDLTHFTGTDENHPVQVQVDVWASDAATRRTLAASVRSALRSWSGAWGGCVVSRAFKVSDFDGSQLTGGGLSLPLFRTTMRWDVWLSDPDLVAP